MDMNTIQNTATPQSAAAAAIAGTASPQPDPDSVKMFVGQIPKGWNETDMRKILEEFGPIYYINILRDQVTGESKGCCFVTYYTRQAAMDASGALHNHRTLPGCQHPMQMKCADSESRKVEERKLFIGMLQKSYGEEDVKRMLQTYGNVEEVRVLRDFDGHSKGCAFAVLSNKFSAERAIKDLHHSRIMDGCSSSLVVKYAETSKEKEQKKLQQMTSQLWNGLSSLGPQYYQIFQMAAQAMANSGGGGGQMNQNVPPSPAAIQQIMQMGQQMGASQPNSLQLGVAAALANNGGSYAGGLPPNTQTVANPSTAQWGQYAASMTPDTHSNQLAVAGAQQFGNLFGGGGMRPQAPQATGKQAEGPEGCNLFIYHLPKEFSDHELAQTFQAFGNVLSAKVFVDKMTSTSKGFGFVSYDSPVSAQAAIQAMNGFQVGTKRLKVSVKRSKVDAKPY